MVELGFKKQFFSSILSTKDKSPIKSRLEKNLTGVLWVSELKKIYGVSFSENKF